MAVTGATVPELVDELVVSGLGAPAAQAGSALAPAGPPLPSGA